MNVTSDIAPRKATEADFDGIVKLLHACGLPTSDLSDLTHFFVIEHDGEIIATAGVEAYDHIGLLRSVAVHKDYRNRFLATILIDRLTSYVSEQRMEALYLVTTTAEHYFSQKGFHPMNRDEVPAAIARSTQFSSTCPSTAIVMMKKVIQ